MEKHDKVAVSIAGAVFIIGVFVLLTGCSTVETKTAEYCETQEQTFVGIPYDRKSDCVGLSVEGAEGGIGLPIGGDDA